MKRVKKLLLVLSIVLLSGCTTIIRLEHPAREESVKYPIGGLKHVNLPIRGGVENYDIAVNHFEVPVGDFYVYSSIFYKKRGILPFRGRILAILKFVDQGGASNYALVYSWWTNANVELSLPEAFEIEIDNSLYSLEYEFYSLGKFVYFCPLTVELVGKLKSAAAIRIWEITIEGTQKLILQSFFADTDIVTYYAPLEGN